MIYPKLSDGTIDWCVMCKHEGRAIFDGCCECEYPENSDDPPTKYEPKRITNAERIRSMSDEELDKFLGEVQWDVANYCGGVTQKQEYPFPEQRGAWLDWLKQEAING